MFIVNLFFWFFSSIQAILLLESQSIDHWFAYLFMYRIVSRTFQIEYVCLAWLKICVIRVLHSKKGMQSFHFFYIDFKERR